MNVIPNSFSIVRWTILVLLTIAMVSFQPAFGLARDSLPSTVEEESIFSTPQQSPVVPDGTRVAGPFTRVIIEAIEALAEGASKALKNIDLTPTPPKKFMAESAGPAGIRNNLVQIYARAIPRAINQELTKAINDDDPDALNRLVVDRGLDVNMPYEGGLTLLHFAAAFEKPEFVAELIRYGANVNATTNDGMTPLDYAVLTQSHASASVLRRFGGKRGAQ